MSFTETGFEAPREAFGGEQHGGLLRQLRSRCSVVKWPPPLRSNTKKNAKP